LLRLFIAVELTEEQKHQLSALQNKIKGYLDGMRRVRPEGMHLTLKFLGDIEEERTALIQKAMDKTAEEVKPFNIQFGSCGVFPSPKKARVLWIGLKEGEAPVRELAGKLETNLADYGFEKDKRSYHPHLTIGRLRNTVQQEMINRFLDQENIFETSAAGVDEVILYQSCLSSRGAVHTAIHRAAFKRM